MPVLYFGLHWFCKLAVSLTLIWATTPAGSHAAAWVGAQTPSAQRWVQAGIAKDAGQTLVYVEWNRGMADHLHTVAWRLGRTAHARLEHRGGRWRAGIADQWTPWLRLPHERHATVLELDGFAHAGAVIAGRSVVG